METGLEGCLSLGQARVLVEVERATEVTVEAQNLTGEPVTIEAKGMRARILQHEIDHLDGVLMLDRTSPEQAKAAKRALARGEPYRPPRAEGEPSDCKSPARSPSRRAVGVADGDRRPAATPRAAARRSVRSFAPVRPQA